MGPARELKKALEKYWSQGDEGALLNEAARVRALHWKDQAAAGIDLIPSGDFSLYDHVLDTAAMLGAFPERYGPAGETVSLSSYFAMARGSQAAGMDLPALEMTKWFDTNYHYIVPQVDAQQRFRLSFTKAIDHFEEARALGVKTRPVLLGPVTFLSLAKPADGKTDPLSLLDGVLPVYEQTLARLSGLGAGWVQMDEPILVTDLDEPARKAFPRAYARLRKVAGLKIMLATYFGDLRENLDLVLESSLAGLHVDLVRGPAQGEKILSKKPKELVLSLGLVDGRNIWKADLEQAVSLAERFVDAFGTERVIVAPSCSLLHCPEDLSLETELDSELLSWMAFARQKAAELAVVAGALNKGRQSVSAELEESRLAQKTRQDSPRTMNRKVRERLAGLTPAMARRKSPYAERRRTQAASLRIPLFPTTTIGSFPQTQKVRAARAEFRKGALTTAQYEQFLK